MSCSVSGTSFLPVGGLEVVYEKPADCQSRFHESRTDDQVAAHIITQYAKGNGRDCVAEYM